MSYLIRNKNDKEKVLGELKKLRLDIWVFQMMWHLWWTKIFQHHTIVPNVSSFIIFFLRWIFCSNNLLLDLSETHCKRSALALIDSNTPWDMHRPLTDSCTLQLLNFTIHDPSIVNRAFWRTCSFLLGAALTNAFKDQANLNLHSFPSPNCMS